MRLIADLHIHSHFSRATGKSLTFEYLEYWAKVKGVNIIGTGDITHPGWISELKEKLAPAEYGFFKLKDEFKLEESKYIEKKLNNPIVRFLLSGEISNIYKKNGKVRKVHNIIIFPDLQSVLKLQNKLREMGAKIESDGRPILGLDSKILFHMALEINEKTIFIPAHIWTPWFSMLGDKSGFDHPEECFEDLTQYIYAIETGLSTDPPINWTCSFLDRFLLTSNSDAHSPEKIGRNANILDIHLDYNDLFNGFKNHDLKKIKGTIDLFPQEGKYHFDGHRNCKVSLTPTETKKYKGICPVCKKPVTKGVLYRVGELADREYGQRPENAIDYKSMVKTQSGFVDISTDIFPTRKIHSTPYHRIYSSCRNQTSICIQIFAKKFIASFPTVVCVC